MKKLVGITMIALLIGFNINAQQRKGNGMRKGSDFTPEQRTTLMVKKMTLELDLNANQQKEVYTLMLENANTRATTRDAHRKMREEGAELTSDQKYNLEIQRLDKQIENKAAMKSVLTNEQYEKWEKMAKNRKRQGQKNSGRKQVRNGK